MKEIVLFDSLSSKKKPFVPLIEGKASIYVCGPTVYSSPHVGNFRPPVVFDVLRRLLIEVGYDVTYVSNYTDVDDKIINEAIRLGISEKELTEKIILEYKSISDSMGILEPDFRPTPTKYMGQIIKYIEELVEKGYAYEVEGDVYFRVKKAQDYGALSGNTIEHLEQGARIEISDKKEDPLDFALWKKTEIGIKWDSPWGKGRPGWHSECCVMIDSIFKEQNGLIDIHGGGFDLKFPHHENEMAQSQVHNGNGLARYWVHNGFVNLDNEKMSKSLGNVKLAKDVVATYGGAAFRLALLSAHYRAPINLSDALLQESKTKAEQLEATDRKAAIALQTKGIDPYALKAPEDSAFMDAISDDINTPNALSCLYDNAKKLNVLLRNPRADLQELASTYAEFHRDSNILGLNLEKHILTPEDKALLDEYNLARSEKDFAKSDSLRGTLIEKGLI